MRLRLVAALQAGQVDISAQQQQQQRSPPPPSPPPAAPMLPTGTSWAERPGRASGPCCRQRCQTAWRSFAAAAPASRGNRGQQQEQQQQQ